MRWVRGFMVAAMLAMAATSAQAAYDYEDFSAGPFDVGYGLSNAWQGTILTDGIIDYVSGNSPGLGIDGANASGMIRIFHGTGATNPGVTTQYVHVATPRDADRKVWMSVDILKGTGSGGNYVKYHWARQSGGAIVSILASSEGFSARAFNGTSDVTFGNASFAEGWNRIVFECTYGDGTVAGVASAKLVNTNGITDLGSTALTAGPLFSTSSSANPRMWKIERIDRGSGEPVESYQYADLMQTSNEAIPLVIPEPATLALLALGAIPLLRRRR